MNNDVFGHEWGDLAMIFTSDEVTSEIHKQIVSRMTHFLLASLYPEHTTLCKGYLH